MPVKSIHSPTFQKEKPGSVVNNVGFVVWTFMVCGKREKEMMVFVERWRGREQGRRWLHWGEHLHSPSLALHVTC